MPSAINGTSVFSKYHHFDPTHTYLALTERNVGVWRIGILHDDLARLRDAGCACIVIDLKRNAAKI
jgi:hypothetical protein